MKIVSLNLWGGRVREPLAWFLEMYRESIDIFCFQEVFHDASLKTRGGNAAKGSYVHLKVDLDLYERLRVALPEHVGYLCPTGVDYYGIATFVRRGLEVRASGDLSIYDNLEYTGRSGNHGRRLQWVDIGTEPGGSLRVVNLHGLWNGQGKTDTPDRLEQSRRIRSFMDSTDLPQVVCGDFNLNPETESLRIVAEGMRHLIEEHEVASTRTSFYEKPGRFADYVFTSPGLEVTSFEVLPEEVSDHAALLVEVELQKKSRH
ncbi:MAG TPA: endonuclease/exonuclease/phosphatase family protein [Candidatus Paceibacterota bacterium]